MATYQAAEETGIARELVKKVLKLHTFHPYDDVIMTPTEELKFRK